MLFVKKKKSRSAFPARGEKADALLPRRRRWSPWGRGWGWPETGPVGTRELQASLAAGSFSGDAVAPGTATSLQGAGDQEPPHCLGWRGHHAAASGREGRAGPAWISRQQGEGGPRHGGRRSQPRGAPSKVPRSSVSEENDPPAHSPPCGAERPQGRAHVRSPGLPCAQHTRVARTPW